ncbi:SH3 domain-containing protein [Colletotrichum sojae]|uniref:SH3 domain-containing protein n=1 Tax=Colletotrichum sojae TaxID=2175907 RepID=A0A8H6JYQ3_9PEZI|nr:SH3 domain-containing protein [Colletotrichum sojae]
MDVVADLVTGPFREIIDKGNAAIENAGDNQDMLSESQKLVKGAERCLKKIEPLCARHLEESVVSFTNALKDNSTGIVALGETRRLTLRTDEIADFRLRLTELLWDFDEYTEADSFEKEKFVELRERCRKAAVHIEDILKRMKLDTPSQDHQPSSPAIAASPPYAIETQSPTPVLLVDGGVIQTPPEEKPQPLEPEPKDVKLRLEPPRPPSINPWESGLEVTPEDAFGRRPPPVSSLSSPISEPHSPDAGVDRVPPDEERYTQMSPQEMRSPISPGPLIPRGRTSSATLSASIPEDQAVQHGQLPHYRYSQSSSVHSQPSRRRSQESARSWYTDGAISPSHAEHRASTASYNDGRLSPTSRGPIIPANFPPDVEDGIERVPLVVNDEEGLIPVASESRQAEPSSAAVVPPKDCTIGLSSSFYVYKGFCDGAKEVIRGGIGIKKVKKPGFSGAHVVARCESCFYEIDFRQIEQDVNNSDEANHILSKIAFRPRFLQKSHIATKRADELLFGCVFCIHSQRTLEECDATVFFSQKKLFEHISRHPRPLPQVPGIAVVEEAEVPFNLLNNYDIHFRTASVRPSPMADRQLEISQLPLATATQTVKRMYGMRLLYDQTPAFELANGARISGVEFPSKYNGEWIMGWHEGNYGSAPVDVLKLEPPPKAEIRMDTTSNISAIARWKFAPRSKDGGDWLKFDQGEKITSISWAWQDHWCWSGTNAKGVWGIFPQTHVDTNTIRESSDRSSISSNEKTKSERFFGMLATRKNSQRPSSVAEVTVPSGRSSVF